MLRVAVSERQCAFVLRADGSLFEVDGGLVILSRDDVRCTEVPVVSGRFSPTGGRFEDARLARLARGWRSMSPALAGRFSEIRLNPGRRTTLFVRHRRLRVELVGDLNGENIRRIYGAFAYLEEEGFESGLVDLRGSDALFVPE